MKVASMEKIPGRSGQQWEGRKWTTARLPDRPTIKTQLNPGGWDVEGWWEPRAARNRPRRIGSHQKRKEKQRTGRRKSRGVWRAQTFGIATFGLPHSLVTRG